MKLDFSKNKLYADSHMSECHAINQAMCEKHWQMIIKIAFSPEKNKRKLLLLLS